MLILVPFQASYAMDSNEKVNESPIYEHLVLKIPSKFKDSWLQTEKLSWQPWLEEQKGFESREIYWDPKNETATILIRWNSKKEWKAISEQNLNEVQKF